MNTFVTAVRRPDLMRGNQRFRRSDIVALTMETEPAARVGRRVGIEEAALSLLEEGGPAAVTSRAVAAAAGVQAVAIYRGYGDMPTLLDAAVDRGFRKYLELKTERERLGDPVDDLRRGWDLHVGFGLEHPHVYALMYGRPDITTAGAAARQAQAVLAELVEAVARAGRLSTDVTSAALAVHSAGRGVTLSLIGIPQADRDTGLSHRVREAVLASLTIDTPATASRLSADAAYEVHAVALAATLPQDASSPLTAAETALMTEWLNRLSRARSPRG